MQSPCRPYHHQKAWRLTCEPQRRRIFRPAPPPPHRVTPAQMLLVLSRLTETVRASHSHPSGLNTFQVFTHTSIEVFNNKIHCL